MLNHPGTAAQVLDGMENSWLCAHRDNHQIKLYKLSINVTRNSGLFLEKTRLQLSQQSQENGGSFCYSYFVVNLHQINLQLTCVRGDQRYDVKAPRLAAVGLLAARVAPGWA